MTVRLLRFVPCFFAALVTGCAPETVQSRAENAPVSSNEIAPSSKHEKSKVEMYYINWGTLIISTYGVDELMASYDLYLDSLNVDDVEQVLEFLDEPVDWSPTDIEDDVDGRLLLTIPVEDGTQRRVFASRTLVCDLDVKMCRTNTETFRQLVSSAALRQLKSGETAARPALSEPNDGQ